MMSALGIIFDGLVREIKPVAIVSVDLYLASVIFFTFAALTAGRMRICNILYDGIIKIITERYALCIFGKNGCRYGDLHQRRTSLGVIILIIRDLDAAVFGGQYRSRFCIGNTYFVSVLLPFVGNAYNNVDTVLELDDEITVVVGAGPGGRVSSFFFEVNVNIVSVPNKGAIIDMAVRAAGEIIFDYAVPIGEITVDRYALVLASGRLFSRAARCYRFSNFRLSCLGRFRRP